MEELTQLQDLLDWLRQYKVVLWSMAGFSVIVIISSMVVIPWLIIRIPDDYFIRHLRPVPLITAGHPVLALLLTLMKNGLGLVLIVAGVIMLILPGQGILTIIAGLLLTNFPGKSQLVHRIVSQKHILNAMNGLRQKAGKSPVELEYKQT